MFNRALQVKMVKAKKTDSDTVSKPDAPFEEKAEIIGSIAEGAIKKVGVVVILFVIADTARKVLIEIAKS